MRATLRSEQEAIIKNLENHFLFDKSFYEKTPAFNSRKQESLFITQPEKIIQNVLFLFVPANNLRICY